MITWIKKYFNDRKKEKLKIERAQIVSSLLKKSKLTLRDLPDFLFLYGKQQLTNVHALDFVDSADQHLICYLYLRSYQTQGKLITNIDINEMSRLHNLIKTGELGNRKVCIALGGAVAKASRSMQHRSSSVFVNGKDVVKHLKAGTFYKHNTLVSAQAISTGIRLDGSKVYIMCLGVTAHPVYLQVKARTRPSGSRAPKRKLIKCQ